jgi:hypothetical protein
MPTPKFFSPLLLLGSFFIFSCGSPGGVLPVKTDWEKENLQGKVKSITSQNFDLDSAGTVVDSAAWNNPDTVNLETRYYNPQGFITEKRWGDGVSTAKTKLIYTYNSDNRLVKMEYMIQGNQGSMSTTYQYNRKGQLIKQVEEMEYVNGTQTQKFKNIYQSVKFDAMGNILKANVQTDNKTKDYYILNTYNEAGKRTKSEYFTMKNELTGQTEYSYNAHGDLLSEKQTGPNRPPDEKEFTYDEKGNILSESYTVESGDTRMKVKNEYAYIFDAQGNWVQKITTVMGIKQSLTRRIITYYP